MIGAAAFTITEDRRQRVEFTDAVDIEPFGFIYRRPTSISKLTFLMDPFEWEVWIGVGILVTLIGTALLSRAGNEPSRSFEVLQSRRAFSWLKAPTSIALSLC